MGNCLKAFLICLFFTLSFETYSQLNASHVEFGDPFILLHNGKYYAYGTESPNGIAVYESDDLVTWSVPAGAKDGLALSKDDVWGDRWFWAPEIYRINNKFYMYFSADEHICVATSDSPVGPFKQEVKQPMLKDEKSIDNSLFIDDDGTPYLFWVRFNDGLCVWVAELEKDYKTLKMNTAHKCINVSADWENVWPRVNEGPFVIKHKGLYYMTYSANSYESQFYGIGYAVADKVMGEWKKSDSNPVLQNPGNLYGVGHSALFRDKNDSLRIVYHAHKSKYKIHPRGMYLGYVSFTPQENGPDKFEVSSFYDETFLKDEKVIRILAIGNSFSEDAVENHLYQLGKDKGIKFIIGNMYIGGCSLERHRNNVVSKSKDYSYRKVNKDGVFTSRGNVSIEEALKDENWDYISFQQASHFSGIEGTYYPYLLELKKYAKENCSNENVKFLFHQTWAYSRNSTHGGFASYDRSQNKMFDFIRACSEEAVRKADIDIMIPSGTAVQNVRNTEIGDNMCRDGYHLDMRVGRYTAACTWFEAITKIPVTTNSYVPENVTPKEASLIKESVHKACVKY